MDGWKVVRISYSQASNSIWQGWPLFMRIPLNWRIPKLGDCVPTQSIHGHQQLCIDNTWQIASFGTVCSSCRKVVKISYSQASNSIGQREPVSWGSHWRTFEKESVYQPSQILLLFWFGLGNLTSTNPKPQWTWAAVHWQYLTDCSHCNCLLNLYQCAQIKSK